MIYTFDRVIRVPETKPLKLAVCMSTEADNVGRGRGWMVQGAEVVAARAKRAHHYCQGAARGHTQLSRGLKLAKEVVHVREVHAHQVLRVTIRLFSLFHNFDCDARAQRGVEFRVRAPTADIHAASVTILMSCLCGGGARLAARAHFEAAGQRRET